MSAGKFNRIADRLRCLGACGRISIGLTLSAIVFLVALFAFSGDAAFLKLAGVAMWFTGIYALLTVFFPRGEGTAGSCAMERDHAH